MILGSTTAFVDDYDSDEEPGLARPQLPVYHTRPASKCPQYFAALSATLGSFSFGCAIGWNSPASVMIQENLGLKPKDVAWIGSLMMIGASAAMLPVPVLLNRFGRKRIMLIIVIPFVIGWLILAFVDTLLLYCLGRFITGFCAGSYCVSVPIFIGEIAQPDVRGILGTFFELLLVAGVCFSFTVGSYANVTILSLSCMGCIIIFAIIFIFVPETPYYYMLKGKREKAEKSLRWYRGAEYDIEDEIQDIEQFILKSQQQKVSIRKRFTNRAARKSLLIGCGLICAQQLNGISAITFHVLDIFKESATSLEPKYSQMAVGFVQLIATLFTSFTIDRAGRKVLLTISLAGMGVCLIVLGVYYTLYEQDGDLVKDFGWVPVTLICLDIGLFSLGVGPISWLMMGELFPSKIKSIACSICSCLSCFLASVTTLLYPFMTDAIGKNFTFWIYGSLCFVFIVFVVLASIETKGKSLRQIQSELAGLKIRR